ncbi:MAG: alpha/beta hydrolase, partial [Clostridia bacterium]|nr:alpha/beta hydrolase [Clostridia bacterium]
SMGGATVLMASGLDLPSNVRGILADCPFSSPKDIINKVCKDMGLPANAVYPFIRLGAKVFAGFDLEDATAIRAMQSSNIPVTIIHGEDDRFVPCAMGREIARAYPETVRFHSFPDAGHGISYMQDKERYRAIIRDFVKEVI